MLSNVSKMSSPGPHGKYEICWSCRYTQVIGILLKFGIGILRVTTPSWYIAVPPTCSSSLTEIGNGIFLCI